MSLPLSEPIEHVAQFLIYVMPGFVALHLYRAKYPVKGLSEFLQVAWSLIYGVVLASLVRSLDDNCLAGKLHSEDGGIPALPFILALMVAGVAWGLALIGFRWLRFTLAKRIPTLHAIAPDEQSVWAKVNEPSDDWAVVYLDDNSIYGGYVKGYAFDPDAEDNDFLLSDAKRVNQDLSEIYSITGAGVYLNTKNVKRIEFVKGASAGPLGDDGF